MNKNLYAAFLIFVLIALISVSASAEPPASKPTPVSSEPSVAAPADEPQALTLTGSFFTRYELRNGTPKTTASREPGSDVTRYRARIGLHSPSMKVTESLALQAHFVPQAGGYWHVGGNSLEDPALGLHEGFVELAAKAWKLGVGRFEMVYGDHLVIGNVGWHHLGRAFDGARLSLTPFESKASIDVFCTTLDEGLEAGFGNPLASGDLYFAGIYGKLGPAILDKGMDLDVYLLSRIWGSTDVVTPAIPGPDSEWDKEAAAEFTAGVRTKGSFGPVIYRLEAGGQFGGRQPATAAPIGEKINTQDVLAYHGDLEVGVNFMEQAHLEATIEGFYASGDEPETPENEAYNQLFPTAHKWLGLMDVVPGAGRSNIYGGVLHLASKLDALTIKLDAHRFYHPEVAAGADQYFGSELDLDLTYTLGGGVKLRALYGQFYPEEDALDDLLHYAELELSANF
ncbi:MAG: hypothetical protein AUK47_07555 [Deltaproteobacteria bacterium CG2_30_63_29]|nr:MAG: hypothetical protein AUK47_07555 [Deltaproteobacteria bacterium CG2_30_63_29]PIW02495.1 MAG: hypothetical protein COW42_01420 [Deltaproteobacteria bacterium CG17_big_fil_post_rev_8_21_14_2_50_63_7]PJB34110.1 MAG: hypothetical protein CO108_29190 [Deltaproteobacteria bacterium CG_4_9_14_3_um_filter_63_12]